MGFVMYEKYHFCRTDIHIYTHIYMSLYIQYIYVYIYTYIYVFIHPIQLMVFLSCSMYKDNGYFHFLKIVPKYVQISILTVDEYTEMHNN